VGEGFLHVRLISEVPAGRQQPFYAGFACPEHHLVMGKLLPYYFSFNEPDSACVTCLGLGIYLSVHPDLLVPDKQRSLRGGAFLPEAFRYDKNTWNGRVVYSMAKHYGFSLDTPFQDLPPEIVEKLFTAPAASASNWPSRKARRRPIATLASYSAMTASSPASSDATGVTARSRRRTPTWRIICDGSWSSTRAPTAGGHA
jgi:excinuclease UvrABC ATPase subunit